MRTHPFRNNPPIRTYSGPELSDYRDYKDSLANDFRERCGYTDCHHFWFGGKRNFQIDHFKPQSTNPELETKYSNLVYACSYVNRAKSNDTGNFIDPCNINYNDHFYRDGLGNIIPKDDSVPGKYMYQKLKLFLRRYGIIWTLDQLEKRMFILEDLIRATRNQEAINLYAEIGMKYSEYKKYLRAEQ